MEDQCRLLDFTRTPRIILYRIDHLLDHVWKEEDFSDQQLCKKENDSSLDQTEPEPLHMKEEQQEAEHPWIKEEILEICIGEDEEQLVLKQEADNTFMVTPTVVEKSHIKPEPIGNQGTSLDSDETENQDQEGNHHEDSGSERDQGPMQKQSQICDFFTGYTKLKKLLLKSHTDEKCFKCLTCGKGFTKKSYFDSHVRMHTGEKPFSCKTCGKKFNYRTTLKTHMKIHTGEKPFSCTVCGKGFTQEGNITVHMRIHTGEKPFLCKTCGKKFKWRQTLKTHMRIHTGEKPFSCTVCGEGFTLRNNLTCHMRSHTVEVRSLSLVPYATTVLVGEVN